MKLLNKIVEMLIEEIVKDHAPDPNENPWVLGRPNDEAIEIVFYDPTWARLFLGLTEQLKSALGGKALDIIHVGSTAVRGLAAKPIIDVDLIVEDSSDEDAYVPELENHGYILLVREPSWHEHRCLRLENPRVNLHVFSPNCPEVVRHQMFRNWLLDNPDDRALYEKVKRDAAEGSKNVAEYNNKKQYVVKEIYQRMFKAVGYIK